MCEPKGGHENGICEDYDVSKTKHDVVLAGLPSKTSNCHAFTASKCIEGPASACTKFRCKKWCSLSSSKPCRCVAVTETVKFADPALKDDEVRTDHSDVPTINLSSGHGLCNPLTAILGTVHSWATRIVNCDRRKVLTTCG